MHPSYKGLREDVPVPPAAFLDAERPVRGGDARSTVDGPRPAVTNLDKVLYPEAGFTKRDVIEYLVHIAPVLLPHLARPPADAQALPQRRRRPGTSSRRTRPKHRPDWVRDGDGAA